MKMIDEHDFISRLALAMDMFGYKVEVDNAGEYPASVFGKVIGYEKEGFEFVGMLLPDEEQNGNQIRFFQIYISVFEKKLSKEKEFEVLQLLNKLNTSQTVGVFGYMEDFGQLCFKQAIILKNEMKTADSLNLVMDTLFMMCLRLDVAYNQIAKVLED